jgi:hypothetical protein
MKSQPLPAFSDPDLELDRYLHGASFENKSRVAQDKLLIIQARRKAAQAARDCRKAVLDAKRYARSQDRSLLSPLMDLLRSVFNNLKKLADTVAKKLRVPALREAYEEWRVKSSFYHVIKFFESIFGYLRWTLAPDPLTAEQYAATLCREANAFERFMGKLARGLEKTKTILMEMRMPTNKKVQLVSPKALLSESLKLKTENAADKNRFKSYGFNVIGYAGMGPIWTHSNGATIEGVYLDEKETKLGYGVWLGSQDKNPDFMGSESQVKSYLKRKRF